jgi:hypothetical protein
MVHLTKNIVFVLVKEGPTKLRSAKAKKLGSVLTECEAFPKQLKEEKWATLE